MGDRGNVRVSGVHLYTHWGGSDLPKSVQAALKKEWRWDDEIYLARIIFDEMVGDQQGQETGFGISAEIGDGEDQVVTVDCDAQRISYDGREGRSWTFQEFIAASPAAIGF